MKLDLRLDRMTTEEKLLAMEEIWGNLCRTPEDIPSPEWHQDVLRERQSRVEEGASAFVDWPEAKPRILEATGEDPDLGMRC